MAMKWFLPVSWSIILRAYIIMLMACWDRKKWPRKGLVQIEYMNAWLQTITYRKSISYLRKETGKNELSFDEISDFSFEPVQSPDEEIISKEEVAEINNAIEKLPPKCKHVFFLAKIEGLPYIKIAEMLEVSVQTVNYHIAYAIEALSKSLKIASPKKK